MHAYCLYVWGDNKQADCMQVERRSNKARSRETRNALLDAARSLFVERGYADSSTPMIVKRAGTTRGALYHHYPDKKAIFRAVLEREAESVAKAIEAAEGKAEDMTPLERLLLGADAYLESMQVDGRTRLVLVDGHATLGASEMVEIEGPHARKSLQLGLQELTADTPMEQDVLAALCDLLSAMFDQAALRAAEGASTSQYRRAIYRLLAGLADPRPRK